MLHRKQGLIGRFRRQQGHGREGEEPQSGTAERRAQPVAHYEIDSDPRRLRSTLADVGQSLAVLEPRARRKVRHLSAELIARSVDEKRDPRRPLALKVYVFPSTVRLELSGLDEPWRVVDDRPVGATEGGWNLYVEGLADRWGVNRRSRSAADAWFEVDRPSQHGTRASADPQVPHVATTDRHGLRD